MKLSPDHRVLALQRTTKTVIFVNHAPGLDASECGHARGPAPALHQLTQRCPAPRRYAQGAKAKSGADIVGFHWTAPLEILLVTNLGLELFQVVPEKRALRALKSVAQPLAWANYSVGGRALAAGAAAGYVLTLPSAAAAAGLAKPAAGRDLAPGQHPGALLYQSQPSARAAAPWRRPGGSPHPPHPAAAAPTQKSVITKLPTFEVELPSGPNQLTLRLAERDVNMATM
jgi:hypothetical protein